MLLIGNRIEIMNKKNRFLKKEIFWVGANGPPVPQP